MTPAPEWPVLKPQTETVSLDSALVEEWLKYRTCQCGRYKYPTHNRDAWKDFKEIPLCGNCGKWADRMMTCARCRVMFYNYFRHPRMGYHPKGQCLYMGWFCWNCLEEYLPPIVEKHNATLPKCPPLDEILPPGYKLLGV